MNHPVVWTVVCKLLFNNNNDRTIINCIYVTALHRTGTADTASSSVSPSGYLSLCEFISDTKLPDQRGHKRFASSVWTHNVDPWSRHMTQVSPCQASFYSEKSPRGQRRNRQQLQNASELLNVPLNNKASVWSFFTEDIMSENIAAAPSAVTFHSAFMMSFELKHFTKHLKNKLQEANFLYLHSQITQLV